MAREAREWIELLAFILKSFDLILIGAGIGLILIWRTRMMDRSAKDEARQMEQQSIRQHQATMEALRITAIKMGYLPIASPVSAPSASSTSPSRSEPNSSASGVGSKLAHSKPSQSSAGSED